MSLFARQHVLPLFAQLSDSAPAPALLGPGQIAMERAVPGLAVLVVVPAHANELLLEFARLRDRNVLGQVLRNVSAIFGLVDEPKLTETIPHAPMHLRIDDALRRAQVHHFLGDAEAGRDRPRVGPDAVKNPSAIGAEQRAGGAGPEMLLNVLGVELQSRQLVRTRDHPQKGEIRQPGLPVAAADIRMSACEPDLLHALPFLAWLVDPCRCRER